MKKLLIVGAGGFGREVCFFFQRLRAGGEQRVLAGFLDDKADALAGFEHSLAVTGSIESYRPHANEQLLLAIAEPRLKLRIASVLRERGCKFASFVDPTALVGRRVSLGEGVIICPHVSIPCDATIGDFVHLNTSSTIGHDAALGEGCTLSGHCDVTGGAKLGRGVFLGSHAAVLPQVRVGDFARVGAGSVVIKPVPPDVTVFGVPAKRVS